MFPRVAFLVSLVTSIPAGYPSLVTRVQMALPSSLIKYNEIVNSFQTIPFIPAEFGMSNAHFQTIIGSEALRSRIVGPYPRDFTVIRQCFDTPDGDIFYADFTSENKDSDSIMVILHGLESSADSPLVSKMASAFHKKGFTCCLVSFRGCAGEDNKQPGAYHFGFTDDVNQITNYIQQTFPNKNIYLSGFSLGGNVALKFLGELGDSALVRNIRGAVVASVPFDPVAAQGKLDVGISRILYSENFLMTLKKKAMRKISQFPGSFNIDAVLACNTIGDFDDAFIAQIYGFKDRNDYYRKTGSKWWLCKIKVPVVAINARDDPFVEESSLPESSDLIIEGTGGLTSPVRLIYTEKGGHCGFMSSLFDTTISSHGWLAEEMSRAISHIRSGIK
jgi:predicted alpha/beta-fold hydrolase